MTSEQVMLTLAALLLFAAGGCGFDLKRSADDDGPRSPYAERQLWAVVPLRNESGTMQADGYRMADHLARQLETIARIDVMPVNRVIAAMQALELASIDRMVDAHRLQAALGADGLVVGSITAFEPYDPPKIGLAVELYLDPRREMPTVFDTRTLSRAAVESQTHPSRRRAEERAPGGPASAISDYYDAADPRIAGWLEAYAERKQRGVDAHDAISRSLYRHSIDLYSEFVAHLAVSHLLAAEYYRVAEQAGRTRGQP